MKKLYLRKTSSVKRKTAEAASLLRHKKLQAQKRQLVRRLVKKFALPK